MKRLVRNVSGATGSIHENNLTGNNGEISHALSSPVPPRSSPLESENAIDGGVIQPEVSCCCFTLEEILTATNNFDEKFIIGIGGFGKVYQGFIDDGATVVAIKRLNAESKQGAGEFWTEVKMLSKLRHAHLVSLIGYCNEGQEMVLVYEYIARGTLANHLYKVSSTESVTSISPLPWEQRLNICIGAARGLNYLHIGTTQSFIHRDVKATNILLDENWAAKISDFGLSKDTTSHSITHITTNVKGTFGYLDPDYFLTQRLTTKSDVYAFGVVLLEVLCGRPPVNKTLEDDKIGLVHWAQEIIKKGKLEGLIDPSLSGEIAPRCLKSFVVLADKCLHNRPKSRPTMAEVLSSLEVALLYQKRGRTEGLMTKSFYSMINRWLGERNVITSSSGQSKVSPCESYLTVVTQLYRRFSLPEIQVATNNFNKILLVPTWNNVYKACVKIDGKASNVVIKRCEKGAESYAKTLPLHPHVVYLIGFCSDGEELILVYAKIMLPTRRH